MKISGRDRKLILILVGILIFVLNYVFVYSRFNDMADTAAADNTALKPQLATLQGYYQNLSQYQSKITADQQIIQTQMALYPNDVRSEDGIMYTADIEQNLGVKIDSVSFAEPETVMQIRGITSGANGTYTQVPMTAFRRAITFNCSMSYEQLKKVVHYIYATQNYTKLNTVTVSYDSGTGNLSGNFIVDKYYITGGDTVYHQTQVPSMNLGTDNPFGTVSSGTGTVSAQTGTSAAATGTGTGTP
jgi:hypothetical protein